MISFLQSPSVRFRSPHRKDFLGSILAATARQLSQRIVNKSLTSVKRFSLLERPRTHKIHPKQHGANPLLSKPPFHFKIQPSELRWHPRNTNMSKHWLFLFSNKADQRHGWDSPSETYGSNPIKWPSQAQLFLELMLPAGMAIATLLHRLHISSF